MEKEHDTEQQGTNIGSVQGAFARINSLIIENFKSIKNLKIELSKGPNVLVGANASGKTNILEAIDFLRHALTEARRKTPYRPHLPKYWRALDIIYGKNPSLPIRIGLEFSYYWPALRRRLRRNSSRQRPYRQTRVSFIAEFTYSPTEDTLEHTRLLVEIGKTRKTSLTIIGKRKLILEAPRINERISKILERLNPKQREQIEVYGNKVIYTSPPETTMTMIDVVSLIEQIETRVRMEEKARERIVRGEEYVFPFGPILYEFDYSPTVTPQGALLKNVLPSPPNPINIIYITIPEMLSRIVLLRHPDIGALSEPRKIMGGDRLDERARNLPEVLFSYRGSRGEDPPRLRRALKTMFPNIFIAPKVVHGNIVLFAEEGDLELAPPNLPDGLFKFVSLMLALDLEPTLLLVDEIENSMHARLIEYVIDEFSSLSIPVLLATHSPTVIDLVGMDRILVVRRDPISGTIVKRPSSIKELVSRLESEGITISDHMIYGETYQ